MLSTPDCQAVGHQHHGTGPNADQEWKATTGRLGIGQTATYCPQTTVKYYTRTQKDMVGSPWLESPQWRWPRRTAKEPATEGLAEGAVLEDSFLACPLPLLSVDPDLRHPATLSHTTGVLREGPALLLQGRHGQVAPKPFKQAERDSALET